MFYYATSLEMKKKIEQRTVLAKISLNQVKSKTDRYF